MVNGILAILSNVNGNRQSNEADSRSRNGAAPRKAEHSKSWSKSRGHKKHCKH